MSDVCSQTGTGYVQDLWPVLERQLNLWSLNRRLTNWRLKLIGVPEIDH